MQVGIKILKTNQNGFSLVELIMTVVLLSLLSVIAVGKFSDLSDSASGVTVEAIQGAVQDGLSLHRSELLSGGLGKNYPLRLDNNALGNCTQCFEDILQKPINHQYWTKTNQNEYTYNNSGTIKVCTYTALNGNFVCTP